MSKISKDDFNLHEREQELRQLIAWSADHQKDWNRICNPESCDITAEYVAGLVEELYHQKLLTVLYLVINMNWTNREVEWAIERTEKECLAEIPAATLIDRFRHNLKAITGKENRGCAGV